MGKFSGLQLVLLALVAINAMLNADGAKQERVERYIKFFKKLTEKYEMLYNEIEDGTSGHQKHTKPEQEDYDFLDAVSADMLTHDTEVSNQEKAEAFIEVYNKLAEKYQRKLYEATWEYQKDMIPELQDKIADVQAKYSKFNNFETSLAETIGLEGLDFETSRELYIIGKSATPKSTILAKHLSHDITSMSQIWGQGGFCKKKGKDGKCTMFLPLIPHLLRVMAWSRDYDYRLAAWQGFRNTTGTLIKPYFNQYVYLLNIGARQHGWKDIGQSWRSEYEMFNGELKQMMKDLWKDLKPTYEKLHGYVRYKLRNQIFSKWRANISKDGPFPTHLLDMWGFDWAYLSNLIKPYPNTQGPEITSAMWKNKMTATDMVKTAEKFYVSMGLKKMNKNFWKESLFSHDPKKNVDCTVTAWDFGPGDYRIKMPCASVNENELFTVIHEMGHIQYDMLYAHQSFSYRDGANPAFHEAVGDALTLSARAPSFLKAVGLLDKNFISDEKSELNTLMVQALKNIAILPFAITIDFWRWKAFDGSITPEEYNDEWWRVKREYQGVIPPVKRTEKDFDPGANSHICNSTPYARYFIGAVLQFQFHEAMCQAAGHKGKLHRCSVYGSKEAGSKLGAMLELGRSSQWQDALEKLTGQRTVDAGAIKSYFKPLMDWLDEQQRTFNYPIGW